MKHVYVKNRQEWRAWLRRHHHRSKGVWLVFYKQHTGQPTLQYGEAVEEALCFGWIDSLIKKLDEERYARKLTPRNADSRWSQSNKRRIAELLKQGLMTAAGMEKVNQARASGRWDQPDRPHPILVVPLELRSALAENQKAKRFFDQLAPSYQKQFINWIAVAKREQTKEHRVLASIALLEKGEKLGMK